MWVEEQTCRLVDGEHQADLIICWQQVRMSTLHGRYSIMTTIIVTQHQSLDIRVQTLFTVSGGG